VSGITTADDIPDSSTGKPDYETKGDRFEITPGRVLESITDRG
jgi:hypothetical protein